MPIDGFNYLEFYTLSKEDIIVSKLGRFSIKDQEDISILISSCDINLLVKLIESIISKEDFSQRVKEKFINNSKLLKELYNV